MGHPARVAARATYADLAAVPSTKVAELIEGALYTFPRPAPRHANTSSVLGGELHGPFRKGIGGPGGWWILDEPELHFPDATAPGEVNVLDPDIAGWRRERMPRLPATAYFTLAPDWVCEVLSPSTERFDRDEKMPLYAREGVRFAWLIDPIARTFEAYTLEGRRWGSPVRHEGTAYVRVPPFEAVELNLALLWAE